MVVVRVGKSDLESMSGVKRDKIERFFEVVGIEIKREDDENWDLELYPDRPDLYSIFGLSRSLKTYYFKEKRFYKVLDSDIKLNVDSSVKDVRPYIGGAVVKSIELNDSLITYIMDMQEKLHLSIGRDRKKIAIGIHDLDRVRPPFKYMAVGGSSISFVPLGMYSPMTPEEILRNHPKGVEYGHLLSHSSLYPIIIDSDGNVLSMPPIINGTLTQIREDTKNIFIDVTGNDLFTVINAVNLISSNLAELGGYLYRVLIDYGDYSLFLPDLGRERIYVSKRELKEMVGEDINANDVKNSLISMGYTVSKSGNGFNVGIPPYRLDIMHPVDVIEDIIKSYGYGNLRLSLPNKFSMGSEAYSEIIRERLRRIMVGLGYIEVVSLTFTSPERNFKRFGIDETYSPRITNPVVEDQTIYRTWLIPMLMETLENNRHRSLPQRIFEVGRVYRNGEGMDLGALSEESDASFTKVKGTVEKIINSLGQGLEIEEKNLPFLIQGRQSSIILNGKEVGFFGEVHPSIIEKYNLGNPITAFEIYLDVIYPEILNEKLKF